MSHYLCISVTFLTPQYHGRGDGGEPEWPPSPLRLMQAIVAANAHKIGVDGPLDHALQWLERLEPPVIVAPNFRIGSRYRLSVPNNAMDIVGKAWSRGKYFGGGDANPATHRTMKTIRPVQMVGSDTIHFLWEMPPSHLGGEWIQSLIDAARNVIALGWGIDLVVGEAKQIESSQLHSLDGELWRPSSPSTCPNALRVPRSGTLTALSDRYEDFLHRVGDNGFVPVPPLSQHAVSGYRRVTDVVARPCAVFELRQDDGSFYAYPQRKLIHIAGMVRHLAKNAMQYSPPPDIVDSAAWVERYVVGHREEGVHDHRRFSYLPLPSIGHRYADQAVRRIMITAPIGDERWLEHLARRLEGELLKPENADEFGGYSPPSLVRVYSDKVSCCYTHPSDTWHSVTPLILPGHDDRKPAKTRSLIERALAQSGVEQPCTFEWSAFSRFPKSLSAHKYDREGKLTGYIRPDHLLTQTAVHLTLRFDNELQGPGPIAIGAGRHYGFGIMASRNEP